MEPHELHFSSKGKLTEDMLLGLAMEPRCRKDWQHAGEASIAATHLLQEVPAGYVKIPFFTTSHPPTRIEVCEGGGSCGYGN